MNLDWARTFAGIFAACFRFAPILLQTLTLLQSATLKTCLIAPCRSIVIIMILAHFWHINTNTEKWHFFGERHEIN